MILLAIDTSTLAVGLALYDGTQVLSEMIWQSHHHHTVEVAPALQTLLARSQIKARDLSAIGVALGPGSFTSLRIGLGLAKGLALAQNIPLVGIPSLDILAAGQPALDVPMAAILQAGRGRLAVGWYAQTDGSWQSQGELQVLRIEELAQAIRKPTLVCGELTAEERQTLARKRKTVLLAKPAACVRRPAYLAELAWTRWQARQVDDPISLAPIYLHYGDPVPA